MKLQSVLQNRNVERREDNAYIDRWKGNFPRSPSCVMKVWHFFFHNTDAKNDKMKLTLCALNDSSLGQSSIIIRDNRLPIFP